ncbi:hypothetical protein FQR65_LT20579 [Abscondita terminalis]|nr:hypothetical protein FQR65_LT20579 [Abscondita terminalis]
MVGPRGSLLSQATWPASPAPSCGRKHRSRSAPSLASWEHGLGQAATIILAPPTSFQLGSVLDRFSPARILLSRDGQLQPGSRLRVRLIGCAGRFRPRVAGFGAEAGLTASRGPDAPACGTQTAISGFQKAQESPGRGVVGGFRNVGSADADGEVVDRQREQFRFRPCHSAAFHLSVLSGTENRATDEAGLRDCSRYGSGNSRATPLAEAYSRHRSLHPRRAAEGLLWHEPAASSESSRAMWVEHCNRNEEWKRFCLWTALSARVSRFVLEHWLIFLQVVEIEIALSSASASAEDDHPEQEEGPRSGRTAAL